MPAKKTPARSVLFQMRLRPAENKRLSAAAEHEHYSAKSEWARRILLREADRVLDGDAA